MRQQVNALCVVTFDVPAELSAEVLPASISYAMSEMDFKRVQPVGCEVRAVMEEAAIYNNNGDQWEPDKERPWDLWKGGEHILSVSVPYDYVTRRTPMKPTDAANMVAEALNFMAGRTIDDEAAKLRKALEAIRDVPACGNSDPDTMAAALDTIAAIVGGAIGWETPLKPVPVMKCGDCGNDGDDTLTIGIDAVWDAGSGRWTLHYNGDGLDCSACDYHTSLSGDIFPDGLEVSPSGGEVLL